MYDFTLEDLESSPEYVNEPDFEVRRAYSREYIKQNGPDSALAQLQEASATEDFAALHKEEQESLTKDFFDYYGLDLPEQEGSFSVGSAIEGLKDLGKLVYDIPTRTMGALGGLIEDRDPRENITVADRWRAADEARSEERALTPEQSAEQVLPFTIPFMEKPLTRGDISDTSKSTGFSTVAAGSALLGAAAASPLPVPGSSIAGGVAASAAAAYNMDRATFTEELFKSVERETETALTPEERTALIEMHDNDIFRHAVWEAGPEALGNVFGVIPGLKNVVAAVGRKGLKKIGKAVAQLYGVELATETVTQMGQQRAESRVGMSPEPEREWTNPTEWKKSFQEIAPQTFLLTSIMGGGGHAVGQVKKALTPKEVEAEITNIPDNAEPEEIVAAIDNLTEDTDQIPTIELLSEDDYSKIGPTIELLSEDDYSNLGALKQQLSNLTSDEVVALRDRFSATVEERLSPHVDKIFSDRLLVSPTQEQAPVQEPVIPEVLPDPVVEPTPEVVPEQEYGEIPQIPESSPSGEKESPVAETAGSPDLVVEDTKKREEDARVTRLARQRAEFEEANKREQLKINAAAFNEKFAESDKEDNEVIAAADPELRKQARKDAEAIVRANPVYEQMADLKRRGGLDIYLAKDTWDSATISGLVKKYPGLFTRELVNGPKTLQVDTSAQELGYDSADDMIQAFIDAPSIKQETGRLVKEAQEEWDRAEIAQQEAEINSTNEVVNDPIQETRDTVAPKTDTAPDIETATQPVKKENEEIATDEIERGKDVKGQNKTDGQRLQTTEGSSEQEYRGATEPRRDTTNADTENGGVGQSVADEGAGSTTDGIQLIATSVGKNIKYQGQEKSDAGLHQFINTETDRNFSVKEPTSENILAAQKKIDAVWDKQDTPPQQIAESRQLGEKSEQSGKKNTPRQATTTDVEQPPTVESKAEVDKIKFSKKSGERAYPIADRGEWWGDGDYKERGGRLVYVSPDEFLKKSKPLVIEELAQENIDDLVDHVEQGRTLDPLSLYGTDIKNVRDSDGRHRAYMAKTLGIKSVPVLDFTGTLTETSRKAKKSTKPKQTTTPANITQELASKLANHFKRLVRDGHVKVVSQAEADTILGEHEDVDKQTDGGTIQGFTLPSGEVYLVQDNIDKGKAYDVLLHELGAHSKKLLKSDKEFNRIKDSLETRKDEKSKTGDAIRAAMARIPEGTKPENYNEELLSYLIENAPETGIVRSILARLKSILIDWLGMPMVKRLTVDDLRAMAVFAVKADVVSKRKGDGGVMKSVAGDTLDRAIANNPKLNDLWERLVYNVADKDESRRRVVNRADSVTEKTDILTVERLRGKKTADEVERFMDKYITPLLKTLGGAKLKPADLEEYAHALHAPESNKRMQQVNAKMYIDRAKKHLTPTEKAKLEEDLVNIRADILLSGGTMADRQDQFLNVLDGLFRGNNKNQVEIDKVADDWNKVSPKFAGITNKEASDIVKKWKTDDRFGALETANDQLAAINRHRLDVLYEAGLLSDVEYNGLVNGYKHYVPLHRDIENTGGTSRGGNSGLSGNPIKVRKGSMLKVVDILAYSVRNAQSAITSKHRAEADRILYNFAKENPTAGITVTKRQKKPAHDSEGNIVLYPAQQEESNELHIRVDGDVHILTFDTKDKTVARFLESIKDADVFLKGPLKHMATVTRFLAAINTTFSPEFVLSNFARDIQTAGINIEDTEAKGTQGRVVKNVFPAIKGIMQAQYGNDNTKWGRVYRDFSKNGGKIGWMQSYEEITDLAKELKSNLKMHEEGHVTKKTFTRLKDLISNTNMAIENGVRLAVYDEMTKITSKPKAALAAANLTVDFTRRGAAGPAINAMYMFFNAGVQGSIRIGKALARSGRARAVVGGVMATGLALQMLAYATGGEDDQGVPYIDGIPDWEKERNMIFMRPGTEGKYIKIPMPYGYNVFYNIGAEVAKAWHTGKKYDAAKGAMNLANTALSSFNPLHSASIYQSVTPTLLDPMMMIAENKTFTGGKLMPGNNPYGQNKSDAYRFFKSSPNAAKWVAQSLNKITGGEGEYSPGTLDFSPETIELWYDTITGSAGRFVKNMITTPIDYLMGSEIETRRVPFARRVMGEWSSRAISERFYERADEIKVVENNLKSAKTREEKAKFRAKPEMKDSRMLKATEKRLKTLRKNKQRAEAVGRDTKIFDKKIETLQIKFLKRSE